LFQAIHKHLREENRDVIKDRPINNFPVWAEWE
jgi:hypothetical protein